MIISSPARNILFAAALVIGACPAPAQLPAPRSLLARHAWLDNRDVDWFAERIPFFESPDTAIDATYYYRWRLLLAVEVLSPSTARADRDVKRRLYQAQGVPEYWIVDLDARLVERWRPDDEPPEIITDRIEWQVDPALPALMIELPALFREIWGD